MKLFLYISLTLLLFAFCCSTALFTGISEAFIPFNTLVEGQTILNGRVLFHSRKVERIFGLLKKVSGRDWIMKN
ncbi:hypothetical protein MRB53_032482 [Persea americana]|uniref:Uncharacterized protein n=1 Tax=Persea americana TaxID=3435 RepID=A0ACC2KS07_PERAE|nr:hypothetical protein MRB53_032482 [Persea americana]